MKPYRTEKVGREIQRIISDAVRGLQDPRICAMTSVTRVEVSADLEFAKVYVSVFGEPEEERKTLAALQHAGGHLQRVLARSLSIRHCPQLIFHLDLSLKKGAEVIKKIEESMQELEGPPAPAEVGQEPGKTPEEPE